MNSRGEDTLWENMPSFSIISNQNSNVCLKNPPKNPATTEAVKELQEKIVTVQGLFATWRSAPCSGSVLRTWMLMEHP